MTVADESITCRIFWDREAGCHKATITGPDHIGKSMALSELFAASEALENLRDQSETPEVTDALIKAYTEVINVLTDHNPSIRATYTHAFFPELNNI